MSVTMAARSGDVKPETAQWVLGLTCAALWAVKLLLVPRLNINWDEFFFLSNVHAAARGELAQGLQTAYTHLFAWLPRLAGDEIAQIRAARILMVILLGVSALLVQRLAARWFAPPMAWAAALIFLTMWPTLKHGGSFRADSLLLPLGLAALVVLTSPLSSDRRRGIGAGLLLGCATAVSVKAVLLAPVVAVAALGMSGVGEWRRGSQRLVWLVAAALIAWVTLLGAHLLSIHEQGAGTGAAAQDAWRTTMGNTPWFPQIQTLRVMLREQPLIWLAAAAGLVWSLWRRLWVVAACVMALLPIVFYRNTYAYYYVVMWGPACIVLAGSCEAVRTFASRVASPKTANAATYLFVALLCTQGLRELPYLLQQRQAEQQQLVTAVHEIFPTPVAYVDHSGMIASFRKVNFFMSTWGVGGYLANERPFMPRIIERFEPPLLISNRVELIPGSEAYNRLLEEDRKIIEMYYQPYWGPIRIAGAAAAFKAPETAFLQVPFPGRYRLESERPVRIRGRPVARGAVLHIGDELCVQVESGEGAAVGRQERVRLLWADARQPPIAPPMSADYYDAL